MNLRAGIAKYVSAGSGAGDGHRALGFIADFTARLTADRTTPWAPVAALAVGGLPFTAFTILGLYHFYIKGAFFWDSGLLAFLISSHDPQLATPQIFGGRSFFDTHFTPVFILISLIRQMLPVSDAQFFAGFCGFCHALPGLAVFWLLQAGYRWRTPIGVAAASLIALGFAFDGLALAIARYPHFEMLIVGAALMFLVALIQQRLWLAGLFFAICLTTREDAGFHLFAVLALWLTLNRYRGTTWQAQRSQLVFAAIALLYSIAVLALQHAVSSGPSSFARIYLGDPVFAKLGFAVIADRLLGLLSYRTYLILPALIAMIWALHARNPYIVLGFGAFLPWAIVHLFADSDIAGTLSGYYAYPFMIASFWPLAAVLIESRQHGNRAPAALSVLPFVVMIAGSFTAVERQYNPGHIDLLVAFVSPPSIVRQTATDRSITALVQAKAALGSVLVDGSVLALAPNGYASNETVRNPGEGRPNTVIYFVDGYEARAARALADAAGLAVHYRVPGTSIRLATDRTIDLSSALKAFLAPAESPD